MPVTRLRSRRDVGRQATLASLLGEVAGMQGLEDVATFLGRKLSAASGWRFCMVDMVAYADVMAHLAEHSSRPQKAMVLLTRLFSYLPPDGNEVMADRRELARVVGCTVQNVSEIMGELEALGAVYRRKEGRGVRYFVNPLLGTHLAGAVRDRAQAEAPALKLRLVEPAGR